MVVEEAIGTLLAAQGLTLATAESCTGGLLGHSLDDLLDEWAAQEYGEDLAQLRDTLEEATTVFKRCVDHLREEDRVLIDYYASDLADVAIGVTNCWLTLQDARATERKKGLARIYISEMMPQIHSKVAVLRAANPAPIEAKETILAEGF